ncbi:hypothetical protein GZH53_17450 [Flavihumibacter sp. R14]|nr:hypothetical protein [Flavihumibacter soli]
MEHRTTIISYSESACWLEDVEFAENELRFLTKVINKYDQQQHSRNRPDLEKINRSIFQLRVRKHSLRIDLVNYRQLIELLRHGGAVQSEATSTSQHQYLKSRVQNFLAEVKRFKQELFEERMFR